jgi:hypothetical protein
VDPPSVNFSGGKNMLAEKLNVAQTTVEPALIELLYEIAEPKRVPGHRVRRDDFGRPAVNESAPRSTSGGENVDFAGVSK